MKLAPNPSLAITNSLGGALSFVSAEAPVVTQQSIPRDQDGFSSAFRLAQYTTNMINTSRVFNHIDESHKVALCTNFSLFLQYAGDNLSIPGSQPLWISDTADQEDEIVEQVTVIQKVLASWISLDISNSAFIDTAQDRLLGHAGSLSTASYYSGRAYSALTIERKEIHGERSHQNSADRLKAIRKSEVVFGSAAYLVSASESKELRRLCNELIADLTDQEFEANTNEGKPNNHYFEILALTKHSSSQAGPPQLHLHCVRRICGRHSSATAGFLRQECCTTNRNNSTNIRCWGPNYIYPHGCASCNQGHIWRVLGNHS